MCSPAYSSIVHITFVRGLGQTGLTRLIRLLAKHSFRAQSFGRRVISSAFGRVCRNMLGIVDRRGFARFVLTVGSTNFVSDGVIASGVTLSFTCAVRLLLRGSSIPITRQGHVIRG